MYKTLTTSVAAIALMTGATFAQSDSDAEGTLTTEQSAEVEAQDTSEQLEQSAEQTGEAVENAAEDTAQAAEDTAEDAAKATENAAEDAAEGAENMAENAAEETEEAADDVAKSADNAAEEMSDSDVAADAEADAETSDENMAADTDAEMKADAGNDVTSTEGGIDSSFSGMLVGDILGQNVTTQAGEDVGEIDYVVRQGESLAAVIGIGGFLGLGEYTVAVPLEEFSMAPEGDGMVLSSWTEEELKAQPEFDETGVEGLEDDVPLDNAM